MKAQTRNSSTRTRRSPRIPGTIEAFRQRAEYWAKRFRVPFSHGAAVAEIETRVLKVHPWRTIIARWRSLHVARHGEDSWRRQVRKVFGVKEQGAA